LKSIDELGAVRESARQKMVQFREDSGGGARVMVGMATCGIAAGARPVMSACQEEVSRRGLRDVTVIQVGCVGVCRLEPIVEVLVGGQEKVTYVNMTPDKAREVIAEHVVNQRIKTEYTIGNA